MHIILTSYGRWDKVGFKEELYDGYCDERELTTLRTNCYPTMTSVTPISTTISPMAFIIPQMLMEETVS